MRPDHQQAAGDGAAQWLTTRAGGVQSGSSTSRRLHRADPLRALLADEDQAVEKLGQLVYNVAVDHPMWLGDDGRPLEYLPAREALIGQFIDNAARAVLAALREVARNG